jgi:membrane protein implicated in regulation of membrane protease activity
LTLNSLLQEHAMPVLPIIDLLIFLGCTTLAAGGLLKAIHIATSYRPTIFSLAPVDLLLVAFTLLAVALVLAARTWVRLNEPVITAKRRAVASQAAVSRAAAAQEQMEQEPFEAEAPPEAPPAAQPAFGHWERVR